jgi:hypothetical protein
MFIGMVLSYRVDTRSPWRSRSPSTASKISFRTYWLTGPRSDAAGRLKRRPKRRLNPNRQLLTLARVLCHAGRVPRLTLNSNAPHCMQVPAVI